MKVYFHAGLNKAGSTYLQNSFPFNFSENKARKILYPQPTSSDGNASEFSQAIREKNKEQALEHLSNLVSKVKYGRDLLLSTEYLYHQFVKEEQRDLLYNCFREIGIYELNIIFVFRNIYEHAVSAYCHRAGVHPLPKLEEWIIDKSFSDENIKAGVDCYEFWSELKLFTKAFRDDRFNLIPIKYSKDLDDEFSNILGEEFESPTEREANISPSISEAEILRNMRAQGVLNGKQLIQLRSEFKLLSKQDKADENRMREYFYKLVESQVNGEYCNIVRI